MNYTNSLRATKIKKFARSEFARSDSWLEILFLKKSFESIDGLILACGEFACLL